MDVEKDIKKTKSQLQKEKISSLLETADKDNLESQEALSESKNSSFVHLYEESIKEQSFKVGDVVKGRIIAIKNDHVLVDINYKSEGLIPKSDFRLSADQEEVQIGQELDVYIDSIENDEGMMILSKDRADIIRVWKDISKVVENEEVIEGKVIAKVKGGLSVDIGVKAFLPGSQINLRPVRDLDAFIGKTYKFKVIKFNQKRGNIVLSRRVLLQQERKTQRSRILSEIKEGSIVKGFVKNIIDYGVFLDLGGLDGLLHITDMSWGRIKHPSDLVSIGDEIEVKVLKFDEKKNRVSLGLKQMTQDPWELVSKEIKIGDVLKVQIVSLTDYGAFVRLQEGVEGLVHVSEMSWGKKVNHPSQLLQVGEEIDVKILGVDQKNHRISLGIKQLQPNPWIKFKEKYSVGTKLEISIKNITDFGLFVGLKDEEIDGFIHISDLSWTEHVQPKETYKVGETLEAVIKNINIEEEKVSLSVKHLQEDPWLKLEKKYPPGSRHEVTVKKIMEFGLFVELEPGVEGLIHISELSMDKVEKPEEVAKIGDVLKAEIMNVDLEARKIGLSVKQTQLREEVSTSDSANDKKADKDSSPSIEDKKAKKESFFGKALKASLGVKAGEKTLQPADLNSSVKKSKEETAQEESSSEK